MSGGVNSIGSPERQAAVSRWCRSRRVRLCVLHGSRARGDQRLDSDLDLAIWASPLPPPAERMVWRSELEELTELPVQLTFLSLPRAPICFSISWPSDRGGCLEILHASIGGALRDIADMIAALEQLAGGAPARGASSGQE